MKLLKYAKLPWKLLATLRNPWVYLGNRLGLFQKPFTYCLWNGLLIKSRPFTTERSVLNDVWFDLSYEPNAFGIPFDWKQCRTIVDIGANIGTFTLYAASRAPHARIISFEPEPSNAELLRENIRSNHCENRIHVESTALGSKEGIRTLFVSERGSGGHSFFRHTEKSHAITVPTTTLSAAFEKLQIYHCDFLKVDCEGAEEEILRSLPSTILERIDFIALEEHCFAKNHPRDETLKEFLQGHGFTITPHRKSMFFAQRIAPLRREASPRTVSSHAHLT